MERQKALCRGGAASSARGAVARALLLSLVLALCAGGAAAAASSARKDQAATVNQAVALRDADGATHRQQRSAFNALFKAAGLSTAAPPGATAAHGGGAADQHTPQPVPHSPGWWYARPPNAAAIREVAKSLQYGRGVEPDLRLALALFRRAADLGDPEAHGQMGLRYATGLARPETVDTAGVRHFDEPNEQRALLHYYFGAAGGDALSATALGYRHAHGAGLPRSCWAAVEYYQLAAEAVVEEALGDGGLPQVERLRLSMHSSGLRSDRHREVVQYWQHSADRGNVNAQTAIGRVLAAGTGGARDPQAAQRYLQRAADAGDAEAMAHLGHMYASGAATGKPDYARAFALFTKSSKKPSALGLYGLAYLHLAGLGTASADPEKALSLFYQAAELGDRNAHFYLGMMHLNGVGVRRRSVSKAFQHLTAASHGGHTQASYNLAMMHLAGKGTTRECTPALNLLKGIAEKGRLAASSVQAGHEAFFRGQYTQALLLYLAAAEMGIEMGQANAAWMLERGYGHAGPNAAVVAMSLHRRSAEQGNVQSLLALADGYYYGAGAERNYLRAAALYYEAYRERSPEAMFNVGFMHEWGLGVPKDLTLALKFYKMAEHTLPDAALPVAIARTWLTLHSAADWAAPRLPAPLAGLLALPGPGAGGGAGGTAGGSDAGGAAAVAAGLIFPPMLAMQWESLAGRVSSWGGLSSLEGDAGDTALLLVLLAVLWVVLRIRRQRQEALQARLRAELESGAAPAADARLAEQLGVAVPPAMQPLPPRAEVGDGGGGGSGGSGGSSGAQGPEAAGAGTTARGQSEALAGGTGAAEAAAASAAAEAAAGGREDGGEAAAAGSSGLRQRRPLAPSSLQDGNEAAE